MKKSGTGGSDNPRSPTDVDRLVGENIRRLRIRRNLTLAQTAGELGISHQQLQKYETGANRLSAGTLFAAATILGVPIETLFVNEGAAPAKPAGRKATALDQLRNEGAYWLGRADSERTLRQMVQVLKALSSGH
jgi:transcriptional regulator with XRE-family HTH domain